jgi:hypothetical protein
MAALRASATCPGIVQSIDKALKDLAMAEVRACAADHKVLVSIKKNDLAALKAAAAKMTCDAVRTDASQRIASLEAEQRKQQQVCQSEGDAILAAENGTPEEARAKLVSLKSKLTCDKLRPLVSSAITELESKIPKPPEMDTPRQVREAQLELARLGCYRGAANGRLTRSTKTALDRYMTARATPDADMHISDDLLKGMKEQEKGFCAPHEEAPVAKAPARHKPAPVAEEPSRRHERHQRAERERPAREPRRQAVRPVAPRPVAAAPRPAIARPVASAAPRPAPGPYTMHGIGF